MTRSKIQTHNYRVTYATAQGIVRAVTTNACSAKRAKELVLRDFVDCQEIISIRPEFLFT